MTIKELKEKIKENPHKIMNIEWTKTVPIEYLKLLNENLDIKEILKDKYSLTYQAKKCLEELHNQYDNSLVKEVEKFIDFASDRLPNFVFDYELVTEKVARIDYKYISNNILKCGNIHFRTDYCNMPDYYKYIGRILKNVEYYK